MKKYMLCMILIVALCTGGCGAKTVQAEIAAQYKTKQIAATADFSVYGEINLTYTVSYEKKGDTARVTLLAPECVAGITAAIDETGTRLTYDGLAVDTLLPAISGFQPVDALDWIVRDLQSGEPDEVLCKGRGEDKRVVLSYARESDSIQLEKRITLSGDDLHLSAAEFLVNGEKVMSGIIREMSIASEDKN